MAFCIVRRQTQKKKKAWMLVDRKPLLKDSDFPLPDTVVTNWRSDSFPFLLLWNKLFKTPVYTSHLRTDFLDGTAGLRCIIKKEKLKNANCLLLFNQLWITSYFNYVGEQPQTMKILLRMIQVLKTAAGDIINGIKRCLN